MYWKMGHISLGAVGAASLQPCLLALRISDLTVWGFLDSVISCYQLKDCLASGILPSAIDGAVLVLLSLVSASRTIVNCKTLRKSAWNGHSKQGLWANDIFYYNIMQILQMSLKIFSLFCFRLHPFACSSSESERRFLVICKDFLKKRTSSKQTVFLISFNKGPKNQRTKAPKHQDIKVILK